MLGTNVICEHVRQIFNIMWTVMEIDGDNGMRNQTCKLLSRSRKAKLAALLN